MKQSKTEIFFEIAFDTGDSGICRLELRYDILTIALAQLLSAHATAAGGLGFKSRVGQIGAVSPTARHCCDVPSELCSPGAKPLRY